MSRSLTDSVNPIVIPVDFTIRHRPPSNPDKKILKRLSEKEIQFLLSDLELVDKCLGIFAGCHKNVMNIFESQEDLKSLGYIYFDNFLRKYFSKEKFNNPKCKKELKAKVVCGFKKNAAQQAKRTMSEFTNHKSNNKTKRPISEIYFNDAQVKTHNSLDHLHLSVSEIIKKTHPIVLDFLEQYNLDNTSQTTLEKRIQAELKEHNDSPFTSTEEVIYEIQRVENAIRSLAGRNGKAA